MIMKAKKMVATTVIGAGLLLLIPALVHFGNYHDFPGFTETTDAARTRNSIASVVAGIVAQKMYDGNATINLAVIKSMYPDSEITGRTTPTSVDTKTDLTFAHNEFHATNGPSNMHGLLEGVVNKSEFDWAVHQTGPNTYEIGRFGLKFDTTLTLNVSNGRIIGDYNHPLKFNWKIEGTYSPAGIVNIDIQVPLSISDVTLVGTIKN
jgi:hypothetical protein